MVRRITGLAMVAVVVALVSFFVFAENVSETVCMCLFGVVGIITGISIGLLLKWPVRFIAILSTMGLSLSLLAGLTANSLFLPHFLCEGITSITMICMIFGMVTFSVKGIRFLLL